MFIILTCTNIFDKMSDKYKTVLNHFLLYVLYLVEYKIELNKGKNSDKQFVNSMLEKLNSSCFYFHKNRENFRTVACHESFYDLVNRLVIKDLKLCDFTINISKYFNSNIKFLGIFHNEEDKKVCDNISSIHSYLINDLIAPIEMLFINW